MKHLNCLCSDNNSLVIFFSRLLTKFRTFTRKLCWEKVHHGSNKRLQFQNHHHKQRFPDKKHIYKLIITKQKDMLYFQQKGPNTCQLNDLQLKGQPPPFLRIFQLELPSLALLHCTFQEKATSALNQFFTPGQNKHPCKSFLAVQ